MTSTTKTPDLLAIRNEARAFAARHVKALACELIGWQDTGLLPEGKLRALADIWSKIDPTGAMPLAERTATRAAMDAVVASNLSLS